MPRHLPKWVRSHQRRHLRVVCPLVVADDNGRVDGEGVKDADQVAGDVEGGVEVRVLGRKASPVAGHVEWSGSEAGFGHRLHLASSARRQHHSARSTTQTGA